MKLVVITLVVILLVYLLLVSCIDFLMIGFAKPVFQRKLMESSYMIQKKNRIDFQGDNECAGFSSAYLLRHFDLDAQGKEIYQEMPYKMKGGYVYPKSLPIVLKKHGLNVKYCIGNFNALRNILKNGVPVIVVMKRRLDKDWIQYITIVGYDENYIYTADSHEDMVNCTDNEIYNHKIPVEEFKKLWRINNLTMPLYKNTFFMYQEEVK